MKCILCENLSHTHICKSCQDTFLTPSLYKRQLSDSTQVISFYKYSDIKELLHTKHTDLGYHIYKLLAQLSFKKFAEEFEMEDQAVSIAIDDNISSGYSHTAILNHSLKSQNIKPLHSKLRANNSVSYSGKSLHFRLTNPRNFTIKKFTQKSVILVDDIITTGTTLSQALSLMKKKNKDVLFCLTLADARLK
ncbi:MAG: phosphoribosyltransferase family protein [Campylobacterota bacterium]|nr:phosphoribosyltransferase family protein [Campylobacterota bacterium]